MICRYCQWAGDVYKKDKAQAVDLHSRCTGCDCQHKVEGNLINKQAVSHGRK